LDEEKINTSHKEILVRIFISLTIAYLLFLLFPLIIEIGNNTLIPSIFLILIFSSNFFTGNNYLSYLMKKMWKYPTMGIAIGWIVSQIINIILIISWMIRTGGIYGDFDFGQYYHLLPMTVIYLFSLIGLYIGKKRVINEIEKYMSLLDNPR
jgi:hypothetical protein